MALEWNVDSSWTLFLDRDGVINYRIMGGYVTCVEEFKFLDGVLEAFSDFNSLFSNIFIVTNQQGIAKGIMEERNLLEVHRYMEDEVLKAKGKITKSYYAPELKSDEHSIRKPKPAMALKAKEEEELNEKETKRRFKVLRSNARVRNWQAGMRRNFNNDAMKKALDPFTIKRNKMHKVCKCSICCDQI